MSEYDAGTYALYVERSLKARPEIQGTVLDFIKRMTAHRAKTIDELLKCDEKDSKPILESIAKAIHSKNINALTTDTIGEVQLKITPVITQLPPSKPAEPKKEEPRNEAPKEADTIEQHVRSILRIAGAAGPLYTKAQIKMIIQECLQEIKAERDAEIKEISRQAVRDVLRGV